MTRVPAVVRREFLERVRTKGFVIGTVLGPLVITAMMLVPTLTAGKAGRPLRLAVLDATGELAAPVEKALAEARSDGVPRFAVTSPEQGASPESRARLREAVLADRLDGFVVLPEEALGSSSAEYYGRSVNPADVGLLHDTIGKALTLVRLTREGLAPERVESLTRRLELKTVRLSARGDREDRGASFIFSILLLMMMYTATLMWGQVILASVIEEKNSRVVEVVVSSIPSSQLLAGKLLGVGAAGLVQFLVWAGAMALAGAYGSAAATPAMGVPEVTPLLLGSFVVYFLLGFFLYGALYAAIGASVNSVQEAQNLLFIVMAPVLLAMMLFAMVLRAPDSTVSVVLSLIPFLTPLLMFLRVTVLPPPLWQLALSIVLTGLAIAAVVWVAARIYRVGILMYGKRPTFPEMMRWVTRS